MPPQLSLGLPKGPVGPPKALEPGAWLLPGFARSVASALGEGIERIAATAPFRHMMTPGGFRMSVAMTNCGALGWLTDQRGYRYAALDPETSGAWPSLPTAFNTLAKAAAACAGFADFVPDACLINRYQPGARMTLHQDKNESDFGAPIVSVSLGLPATFLFGGHTRTDKPQRVPLEHGDVVVWGGPARLRFHGVLPLRPGQHEFGSVRFNLTFRKAG